MNSEIGVRHIVTTPTGSCTVSEIARPLGHRERGKSGGAVSRTCVNNASELRISQKQAGVHGAEEFFNKT